MIYDEEALRNKIYGFMSRKEIQYPDLSSSEQIKKRVADVIYQAHLPYTHYPRTATTTV